MKNFYLLLILVFAYTASSAQDSTKMRHFTFDVGLGGAATSFQDVKFSNVRWSGYGFAPKIEVTWRKKFIHTLGVDGVMDSQQPKTFDGSAKTYMGVVYYKILYPLTSDKLYVGAKVEPMDMSLRTITGLENNGSYLIAGTNVKVVGMFEQRLNAKWLFNADLGFQLFSFMNENMSFSYAAAQKILEDEKYQYDEMTAPYYFAPFWKYLNIETNINFNYGKRWVFSYVWRMQQSYAVKDYRLTRGYSALMVSYHIISKNKTPKAKKQK
jgi:hypothetical protein